MRLRMPGTRYVPDRITTAEAIARLPTFAAMSRCAIGDHDWVLMTTARQGYVSWDRCSRGCGNQRIRKGSA